MKRRDLIRHVDCGTRPSRAAEGDAGNRLTFTVSGLPPWDFSPGPHPLSNTPVKKGLKETGYIDGQNVAFEYRWDEGHLDRLPALAADLVSRNVDVIVTFNGAPGALAEKRNLDDPDRLRRRWRPSRDGPCRQSRVAGRQPDWLQHHHRSDVQS